MLLCQSIRLIFLYHFQAFSRGRLLDFNYIDLTMVAGAGFEPATFRLWAWRATWLLHPAFICCVGIFFWVRVSVWEGLAATDFSAAYSYSIIGARAFHVRVRDGIEWFTPCHSHQAVAYTYVCWCVCFFCELCGLFLSMRLRVRVYGWLGPVSWMCYHMYTSGLLTW